MIFSAQSPRSVIVPLLLASPIFVIALAVLHHCAPTDHPEGWRATSLLSDVCEKLVSVVAALRDLQEMGIGGAEESPHLVAPIDKRREELGSAGAQLLVGSVAIH